jgi:hypothetical protein
MVLKRTFNPETWKRKRTKMDEAYAESRALAEKRAQEEREARRPKDPIIERLKHDQDVTVDLPPMAPAGWYEKYKSRIERRDFPSYAGDDWDFNQEERARHKLCYDMLRSHNFFVEDIAVSCLMNCTEVREIARKFNIHI